MKELKFHRRPIWFPRLLSSASLTAHRSDSHSFSCRSHPHRGILKLWCGDSILLGAVGTSFWTWGFLRAGSFPFRLGGCVYLWGVLAKISLLSRAHTIIPSAREAEAGGSLLRPAMVYDASSGTARATQRGLYSNKQTEQNKKKIKNHYLKVFWCRVFHSYTYE